MEVSALKYSGAGGLQGRSPLLRLQSDERLVGLVRRGNGAAFELLVSRYEVRLLAFCRHMLGSREDAEDVLQEVMTAAYNAMLADQRPINVRPWLYRIARNRSLNHLRRQQAIGVDSMDIHLSDNGASTADKVHEREEFRMLVGDIQDLPETQRTALVLRELDALSYEQIAEAMETTVPSVKSLLVRARVSLAEASESRLLTCDEVRIELAEVMEGLRKKASAPVRRHVKTCARCSSFDSEMKRTNKALAALLPLGPLALLRKLILAPFAHSAGTGAAGATAAGAGTAGSAGAAGAAGATAAGAGATAAGAGASTGSLLTAGVGAIATKAAAGLAAAALVTAGAVEATGVRTHVAPVPTNTSHVANAVGAGVTQAQSISGAAAAGTLTPPPTTASTGSGATATTTTTATVPTATVPTTTTTATDPTATGTTTSTTTPTSSTTTEPSVTAPSPTPPANNDDDSGTGTSTSTTPTSTSTTGSATTTAPSQTTTAPTSTTTSGS